VDPKTTPTLSSRPSSSFKNRSYRSNIWKRSLHSYTSTSRPYRYKLRRLHPKWRRFKIWSSKLTFLKRDSAVWNNSKKIPVKISLSTMSGRSKCSGGSWVWLRLTWSRRRRNIMTFVTNWCARGKSLILGTKWHCKLSSRWSRCKTSWNKWLRLCNRRTKSCQWACKKLRMRRNCCQKK